MRREKKKRNEEERKRKVEQEVGAKIGLVPWD
jgi:hypothetical protein